jgi:hypothetical protein
MPTLLLVRGGLWEDIGADWFWRRPGIVAGFEHGLAAVPDAEPVTVVGGSFGCSVAVRLGVIPAVPPDPFHPRGTVDSLLRLLPSATELPGCREAPRPEFPPHLDSFLASVAGFAGSASRQHA